MFRSQSDELVPGSHDHPREPHETDHNVYHWDRDTGEIGLVTRAIDGHASRGYGGVDTAYVSNDGSRVLFRSQRVDLREGGVPARHLWLWDRATDDVELVSSRHDGAPTEAHAGMASSQAFPPVRLSSDGRHVIFSSEDRHIVPGFSNYHEVDGTVFQASSAIYHWTG